MNIDQCFFFCLIKNHMAIKNLLHCIKTPTTQLISFKWYENSDLLGDSAASNSELPHIYLDDEQPNARFPANPDNEMIYEANYGTGTGDSLQFTVSGVAPPGICTIFSFPFLYCRTIVICCYKKL